MACKKKKKRGRSFLALSLLASGCASAGGQQLCLPATQVAYSLGAVSAPVAAACEKKKLDAAACGEFAVLAKQVKEALAKPGVDSQAQLGQLIDLFLKYGPLL